MTTLSGPLNSTAGVDAVLTRLQEALTTLRRGWVPETWRRLDGPDGAEIDTVTMVSAPFFAADGTAGQFDGLVFEPGREIVLECDLDVPSEWAGVSLAGERLDVIVYSIFPMQLELDGRCLFEDDVPPVALGPALIELVPALAPGTSGVLRVTIRPPDHQIGGGMSWNFLQFGVPALRDRAAQIDLILAQLRLATVLASTPEEIDAVAAAAAAVPADMSNITAGGLTDAIEVVSDLLAPLTAKLQDLRVHLVGHSHIDLAWLWTWEDTVEVIRRDFRAVLDMLDDYPEMTFTHSQPASYAVIRDHEPALFARVLDHVRSGRWEPATMQWVEGDTNLASGESSIRQLLEGVRFTRDELGASPEVFLAPDTFGHAGNLPQLAASAGARYYYHHRCNPGHPGPAWPAYWWEGHEGSRLLAISTPSYNGELSAGSLVDALLTAISAGHGVALQFYGVGDHGGGPTRMSLDRLRWLQGQKAFPTLTCSTIGAYGRDLVESGASIPLHRGQSATTFEGCYTTHADTKRYNRHGENLLTTAETLAAMAGLDHREALRPAWQAVLFNQFHDILDGSSIQPVYERNRADFEGVERVAATVVDDALTALAALGVEARAGAGAICVTNPLGHDRRDVVLVPALNGEGVITLIDQDGLAVPGQYTAEGLVFVAQVPAFATVQFRVAEPSEPSEQQHWPAGEVTTVESAVDPSRYAAVETDTFRAVVRRDSGIITSLVDRRSGRQLVSFGMRRGSDYLDEARVDLALNVLQLITEAPHSMSAWHYDEVVSEQYLTAGAETEIVEVGPVRTVLEVTHRVRASTIRQRIVFYRQLDRIDFSTDIDWQEIGDAEVGVPSLKVAFTASLPDTEAWCETPFAAAKRNSDGQEVPALRWASVGGSDYSISLLNESKYGHDALGGRLRLSLVRSAYEPDAVSDTGSHHIEYSLVPHAGDWRRAGIPQRAAAFNQPLLASVAKPGATPGATSGGTPAATAWRPTLLPGRCDPSVVVATLKLADRGPGRVVRLYESCGRPANATLGGLGDDVEVWEVSVVEDLQRRLPVDAGTVSLSFVPFQVRTLLVRTP